MVKRPLLLSNQYSKHHNRLNSHISLYSSKWPLPKAPFLKALWPLSNRLSSLLYSHRCNSLHVLLSLTVKRPLLLSNRYNKHRNKLSSHSSNSLNSLCSNKWQLPKTLCLKALLPLSNRLNRLHSHRYSILHALS